MPRMVINYLKRIGAEVEFSNESKAAIYYATNKGSFKYANGCLEKFERRVGKEKWAQIL